MRRQLLPALRILLVMTVLTGVLYPLALTGIAQAAFSDRASGALLDVDGTVVGSTLQGQAFTSEVYFHPRPSAAGDGYAGDATGGSNWGPNAAQLLAQVRDRVAAYRMTNGLDSDVAVPIDAVTASASGLDPHISIANARLQAPRVAETRGLPLQRVRELVDAHTQSRTFGFLGEARVNVLELNLALDDASSG